MGREREYWQNIRGICILAVVLIHSLGGFDYSAGYNVEFIILRQIINFAVATFVFMSGYFVPVEKICNKDFSYKEWILNGGGRLCVPFVIWSFIVEYLWQRIFTTGRVYIGLTMYIDSL